MDELAWLIAPSHERWMPPVVEAILGTSEPGAVAAAIAGAVAAATGAAVAGARFYEPGVGIVVGLDLADGRAVVAKVHRPAFMPYDRLVAVVQVQGELSRRGVPAPAPLAGPVALGGGWLTVEEFRAGGGADGYDPVVRRAMAGALRTFVAAAREYGGEQLLGPWLREPVDGDLWAEPHDLRFDFAGTAEGAGWIDDAARPARATLAETSLANIVGHLDWRVQNLGFEGPDVTAIFDWDSIGLVPEAALVGSASVIHPVDWRRGLTDPLPTLPQVDGFVGDYEAARGEPFDDAERRLLAAAQVWVTAYGARCQHSDDVLGIFPDVDHSLGWPRLLRDLLARA